MLCVISSLVWVRTVVEVIIMNRRSGRIILGTPVCLHFLVFFPEDSTTSVIDETKIEQYKESDCVLVKSGQQSFHAKVIMCHGRCIYWPYLYRHSVFYKNIPKSTSGSVFLGFLIKRYTLFYKNLFYKNHEAEIAEKLRIS